MRSKQEMARIIRIIRTGIGGIISEVPPEGTRPETLRSKTICQSQTGRGELTILSLYSTMNPFRNHVRWFLIFWMFVISAIAYLDRVNISIAGTSMEREYGFDHVKLGLVLSAFAWGYALFQAPGGRLADRFGPRRILAFGAVWWAVFTALTAAVPKGFRSAILVLMAIRFLLGTGEAVVYPAGNRLVASWTPSRERGLANGFIFAGVGAGAGLAPPLITYILLHQGWRWSFWISAGMGLVAGLIWFWLARDKPEQHSWVTSEEAETIRSGLPAFAETQRPLAWGAILSSKDVAAVTFSYFCYGYVAYIFFAWFFIYVSAVRGLDLKSSAYYSMLPFLAMAVCSPLGGSREHGAVHNFYRDQHVCPRYTLGESYSRGRSGRAVSVAEFVLVRDFGNGRNVSRICFGIHEHGRAGRRCRDGLLHTADCQALRMGNFIFHGRDAVRSGRAALAGG